MQRLLVMAMAVGLAACTASASLIAEYTFTGSTLGATTVHADAAAGNMTSGGSLSQFTINTSLAYTSSPVLQGNPGGTVSSDVNTAFTNNNFFYFTITVDPGKEIDFTQLTFNAAKGGSSGTRATGVRTDLTGTTNLLSTNLSAVRPNWNTYTVDLSTYSQLQNVTGAVTFKVAVATPSSGNSEEFDNFRLEGAVTPEPATLALLGGGAGVLALLRRRRR